MKAKLANDWIYEIKFDGCQHWLLKGGGDRRQGGRATPLLHGKKLHGGRTARTSFETRERLLRNLRKAQVLKALYFANPLNVLIDIDVSADSELIGGFEPCNGGM